MEENKENTKALIKTIKNIGKSKKNKAKVPDILNGQDSYNEQVIGKENNNIKTAEE
ncbi:4684_t:CDS:2, partial [Rhizophagus irregularis]